METGGEEEQDGLSVHSPGEALPSSVSSLRKEQAQVELELKILEALEIYPPAKLQGEQIESEKISDAVQAPTHHTPHNGEIQPELSTLVVELRSGILLRG